MHYLEEIDTVYPSDGSRISQGVRQSQRQGHLIFTGRNEVLAKVIFLHLSVIHSVHTGGVSQHALQVSPRGGIPACLAGQSQEGGSPILGGSPIFRGGLQFFRGSPIFFGGLQFFGVGTRHQNTVNVRPVRILLECILVGIFFAKNYMNIFKQFDRARDTYPLDLPLYLTFFK